MKRLPHAAPLFAAICLLAASQPLLAATKKAEARNAELVAALQTVSPDPLGGRLGLAAATARAAAMDNAQDARAVAVQSSASKTAPRAYTPGKGANKS